MKKLLLPMVSPSRVEQEKKVNFFSSDRKKIETQKSVIKQKIDIRYGLVKNKFDLTNQVSK